MRILLDPSTLWGPTALANFHSKCSPQISPTTMLRMLRTPLLLAALCGCQGNNTSHTSPDQASLSPTLGAPPVVAIEQSGSEAASAQDEPADKPVPVKKSADPEDWESVDQVSGQAVETLRRYYPSGHVRRIHSQLKGKIGPLGHHGRDLHLHENGVMTQEAFWVDGKLNGPYRERHESGQLKVETAFQDGKRHGNFQEYGAGGRLRVEAGYQAGQLHGEFRQWYGSGNLQEVSHWVAGKKTGSSQVWGRELAPISLENFVDGVRHGQATVFHRIAGEEKVHQTGKYVRGAKEGVWVEFNPEGVKVQEKEFLRGKVTGYYKEWRDGVLTLETRYVNSVENGKRVEFFANGKPFSRGQMKDGGREGAWVYWEKNGGIQETWSGFYQDGKKIRELTPDEIAGEGSNNE